MFIIFFSIFIVSNFVYAHFCQFYISCLDKKLIWTWTLLSIFHVSLVHSVDLIWSSFEIYDWRCANFALLFRRPRMLRYWSPSHRFFYDWLCHLDLFVFFSSVFPLILYTLRFSTTSTGTRSYFLTFCWPKAGLPSVCFSGFQPIPNFSLIWSHFVHMALGFPTCSNLNPNVVCTYSHC